MSEVSAKHVLGLSVLLALTMAMLMVGVYVSPASGLDEPILTVKKEDDPDPVRVEKLLSYHITVENVGGGAATNVVVTDVWPDSTTVMSASSGCVLDLPGLVVCNLGTIPTGEAREIFITVLTTEEGMIVNIASVTSDQTLPVPAVEQTDVEGGDSEEQPQTKDDCKNGGYKDFGFKNQGQCIKATKRLRQ